MCRSKYLIIILLLFLSVPTQSKTILVLGDSISAAYGMEPNKGWVNLLKEKLVNSGKGNYQVINASISGSTTGDGLQRLPKVLQQYGPSIIILELGGNDGLRGYPVKLMRNNLQKLIDLGEEAGAKILLAGIEIPPNYGQRYTDAFRQAFAELAKSNTIEFLPFILERIATNPNLMQKDQIHPTAAAQPIILENIWPYLKSLL